MVPDVNSKNFDEYRYCGSIAAAPLFHEEQIPRTLLADDSADGFAASSMDSDIFELSTAAGQSQADFEHTAVWSSAQTMRSHSIPIIRTPSASQTTALRLASLGQSSQLGGLDGFMGNMLGARRY